MISFTLKIAAARPIKPILEVFSLKCGVSDIIDAGIATVNLFRVILCIHPCQKLRVYSPSGLRSQKSNINVHTQ
jgi:hypothetical protein